MTIEPHSPPPEPRQNPGEPPQGEWPSAGTLIAIFAVVVVVIFAFIQMS